MELAESYWRQVASEIDKNVSFESTIFSQKKNALLYQLILLGKR